MPKARFWRARVQTPSSKPWPPWPFAGLKMMKMKAEVPRNSQNGNLSSLLMPSMPIAESVDLYRSTLLHRSFQSFQEMRISFVRFKFLWGHFNTWGKWRKMSADLDAGRLSDLAKGAHLLWIALGGSPILVADGFDGIRTTSNFATFAILTV